MTTATADPEDFQPQADVCRPAVASHRLRSSRLVFALGSLLLWSGCTIPPNHLNRVLLVHEDGYAMNENRVRLVPEGTAENEALSKFKSLWGDKILNGIDAYATTLPAGVPLKLMIFVHGGLNTYQSGMERVTTVLDAIQKETFDGRRLMVLPTYHPLFINWNSDLWESIYDDIFELRFGERRKATGYPSALPEAGARLAQGLFNAPSSLGLEVAGLFNGLDVKQDDEWPHCRVPPTDGSIVTDDWRRKAANTFIWALFYPTRVLTAPVIQGFGAPAWDLMKRRAELVMAPGRQATKYDAPAVGAGRLLIEAIRTRISRVDERDVWAWIDRDSKPRTTPLEITVVGHSMGTMVLNHLLETLPDFRIRRVLYLAAADSIHHVYGAVVPYLTRTPHAEFWSFSLSETNEALEVDVIDVIPRGSLLVWIDHFFQRINAPSDRTFGRASNLRQYVEVPPNLNGPSGPRQRFFLVKFGRANDDPSRHGDLGQVWPLERALATAESGSCLR